jgi:predicted amidohydrolase YtcJ
LRTYALTFLTLVAAASAIGAQSPDSADLVIVNAKVVTVDQAFSVAEAVAIRGGRFTLVGRNDQVRPFIAARTRVIDAGGRTVIPGLIDTHVHATGVAAAEAIQPFEALTSIEAIQGWLRTETARTPADAWIWCPRVYPTRLRERRFPTRAELDAVAPHHPVVVDGAYALVLNTAALRAAAITRDTAAPPGGAIVKDAAGEPTGLLRNVGRMLSRFKRADTASSLEHLERVHRAYNRVGITSVIERAATPENYQEYAALKAQNRLRVRSTVTILLPRIPECSDSTGASAADASEPCPAQIAEITRFVKSLPFQFGSGDDMLKAGPLKIVVDGGILIGTSFMREPYGLRARSLYGVEDPQYRGALTLKPQQIRAAVLVGQSLGWQMVAHVTGDAGVDVVLDAYEAAQSVAGAPPRRHTLIHAYFVTPQTAQRAAKLGVPVDTQPAWYYKDADALAEGLGSARLQRFLGLRTWLDAGVHTAINTDHMFGMDPDTALNPFNPFLTMYAATTRRTEGGQVLGADQRVTREEALRMMTVEAAYLSFDEGNRGSIEAGKLGDLVVLSDDLLTCTPEQLRSIHPEATVLGGQVVYERAKR